MTFLSVRAKEAIKTGLAMTIAYGIALQMGWINPYWAGFSVAMISLTTAGQSLNKGVLRMLGTLAAAVCALTFLSWSFQDRWAMLAILTVFIGFCSYMLTGGKSAYGWYVCAYACLIISIDNGGSSAHAFEIAVARVGETAMGILVYALISVFLWPRNNQDGLEEAAAKLFSIQIVLCQNCRSLLTGQGKNVNSGSLMIQEAQLLTRVEQVLHAAETDSYEVREVRLQWRRFLDNSHDLMETLERLRASFPELRKLDLPKFLPNLNDLFSELDMRFAQIERMLAWNAPERKPQAIVLDIDKDELRALSHFEKAALAVSKSELDRLELLSDSLFDTVADIRGYAQQSIKPDMRKRPAGRLVIDPDRLIEVVRVVATLWISYLLWIYVDPAGHSVFVVLAVTFAMAIAMMPMVAATAMFFPILAGCFYSGVLYLLIMPHLSGYWQLGSMIFIFTFAIFYIFWKPEQTLSLMAASSAFLVLTFIKNEQTYNFSAYANTAASMILAVGIIIVCSYIPTSPRPEKIFLRLLNRFFRHSQFLLSRMAPDSRRKTGLMEQWKTALYSHDLAALPVKLAAWGARIDHRSFPNNSPEQVQALVTALHELALRIKAVLDAGEQPQADHLVKELHDDVRAWRFLIEKEFGLWAASPETVIESGVDMPDRLAKRLSMLETRSKATFALEDKGTLNPEDYENFYRLLGSYRGLSESGVKYMRLAGKIDWAHWQEGRF